VASFCQAFRLNILYAFLISVLATHFST
jgi:hypothetical protein